MEPGMSASELVSIEPATGAVLWRGNVSNVDEEVAIARSSWVHWASQPLTVRIETLRRFTDAVRQKGEQLADTIARETGAFIRAQRKTLNASQIESKGKNNFVTAVDKASEEMLVTRLGALFPAAGFITEEDDTRIRHAEWNWINKDVNVKKDTEADRRVTFKFVG